MTPQIALWVLSTLGALIFFGLGWISSLMRRPAAQMSGAPAVAATVIEDRAPLQRAEQSIAKLQADLDTQKKSFRRLEKDRNGLQEALDKARKQQGELEAVERRHEQERRALEQRSGAEISELQQRIEDLRASSGKLGATQRDLDTARAQLEQTRKEADELRVMAKQAERLTEELRDARKRLDAQKTRTTEADRLREELAVLREQCARASGAQQELTQLGVTLQTLKLELAQANKRLEASEHERNEHRALREDNERLRAELAHAAELEAQDKLLRQKVQTAEARGVEADELRQQNRDLRDRLREIERFEQDAKQLGAFEAQLRAVKLDNELLQRRLQEVGADSDARVDLIQKLEQANRRAKEADALQRQVDVLEAKLFALDRSDSAEVERTRRIEGDTGAALQDGPDELIRSGARISVLADSAGLPLASAGLVEHHESLAALSGLALEFADRVTSLLPVSGSRLVQIVDERQMTIYWSLFESHGDRYALAGVGDAMPQHDVLNQAIRRAQGAVDRAGIA